MISRNKITFSLIYKRSLYAIFFFFSLSSFSFPSERPEVTDIRFWSHPDYTRIVINLSDMTEFTKNRLLNPDRLYFDLKNSTIKNEVQKNLAIGNGMLKAVRASQFNENTVRVVLDLEKIRDYKIFTFEEPIRIIVDVYGHQTASLRKKIVLDPGHGGHDPGAVGPNKVYEKDVVLDIALKLKKILSENTNHEILLTRDSDVFIPLEKRTFIANSINADLFVSIHANASPKRNAKGIETYFLNWTDDEEAMKVAARENQISLKKMRKMQNERDVLGVILGDLERDIKRDESLELANYIQYAMVNGLKKNYDHVVDLKVKWALFYVLFGAKMPSVLVEVSFISNPLEEKLLSKDAYKNDLARTIALGINKYMSAAPKGQTIAGISKALHSGN